MSVRTIDISDALYDYLLKVSVKESEPLAALRKYTQENHPWAVMQISPEQGQFMALLTELLGVERYLEVGTFTGYSALAVTQAMAPTGRTICCDVSEEYTAVGKPYWEAAGVAERIDLRIAPALETLDQLLAEGQAGSFDFMFIDADKNNYPHYIERGHKLLRQGGLMGIDNVLWNGKVIDESDQREDTVAIRQVNELMGRDDRWTISLVPIGDGLTLARKR